MCSDNDDQTVCGQHLTHVGEGPNSPLELCLRARATIIAVLDKEDITPHNCHEYGLRWLGEPQILVDASSSSSSTSSREATPQPFSPIQPSAVSATSVASALIDGEHRYVELDHAQQFVIHILQETLTAPAVKAGFLFVCDSIVAEAEALLAWSAAMHLLQLDTNSKGKNEWRWTINVQKVETVCGPKEVIPYVRSVLLSSGMAKDVLIAGSCFPLQSEGVQHDEHDNGDGNELEFANLTSPDASITTTETERFSSPHSSAPDLSSPPLRFDSSPSPWVLKHSSPYGITKAPSSTIPVACDGLFGSWQQKTDADLLSLPVGQSSSSMSSSPPSSPSAAALHRFSGISNVSSFLSSPAVHAEIPSSSKIAPSLLTPPSPNPFWVTGTRASSATTPRKMNKDRRNNRDFSQRNRVSRAEESIFPSPGSPYNRSMLPARSLNVPFSATALASAAGKDHEQEKMSLRLRIGDLLRSVRIDAIAPLPKHQQTFLLIEELQNRLAQLESKATSGTRTAPTAVSPMITGLDGAPTSSTPPPPPRRSTVVGTTDSQAASISLDGNLPTITTDKTHRAVALTEEVAALKRSLQFATPSEKSVLVAEIERKEAQAGALLG